MGIVVGAVYVWGGFYVWGGGGVDLCGKDTDQRSMFGEGVVWWAFVEGAMDAMQYGWEARKGRKEKVRERW